MNGINSMKWGWFDPITGKRHDCASPINGTLPSDRLDDDMFIVVVEGLQQDCFIIWYDMTNEIIFLDIGGLEPCYLLGVISTSDNTMILKSAAVIEKMKVKHADEIKEWEVNFTDWKITDWKIFKEVEYIVVDLGIEDSTSGSYDRGGQIPSI